MVNAVIHEMGNSSSDSLENQTVLKLDAMSMYKNCCCQACYWKWHHHSLICILDWQCSQINVIKNNVNAWYLVTLSTGFKILVSHPYFLVVLGFKKKV